MIYKRAIQLTTKIDLLSSQLQRSNPPTLIIVSKKQPIESIQELYDSGFRIFGENRIEDLLDKQSLLPKDIQWHFIGHIQSKKLNKILSANCLIHSVHTQNLIYAINEKCKKLNKTQNILLQINISNEIEKQGFSLEEIETILSQTTSLTNVQIIGLMGMGPRPSTNDYENELNKAFSSLSKTFNDLKKHYNLSILSMGMSVDFEKAISYGATHLRLGSIIFN